MGVVVIEPPSEIVSIVEAQQHLTDLPEEDEPLVKMFIAAASAWIDGPAGWLGRAIGVQVLEWQRSNWPCHGEALPFPPEIEVISVTYIDPAGVEQEWPVTGSVAFDSMPDVRGLPGDVKIRYRAGYGTKDGEQPPVWTNAAPAPIKVAILMLVAHWYRNREPVTVGAAVENLPFGVEALLSPYRVYS